MTWNRTSDKQKQHKHKGKNSGSSQQKKANDQRYLLGHEKRTPMVFGN